MSKELEAWNFIKDQMQNFTFSHLVDEMVKNVDIIEQALQRLQSIENSNSTKALECLGRIEKYISDRNMYEDLKLFDGEEESNMYYNGLSIIKQALIKAQEDEKKVEALKELIKNHIEFVVEKDRCYFKIKNSKGKEKSFTSYSMLDFWKEVLE